ncbi:MAG: HlyD family efflux transporter periplasmic adaptor subunit [Balneolaceae bacterium]|nr:HlyD family efflux transporter periplasmic adaptor subunit [Balneolaceae bacterium]MBO6546326.1 HlyD family efflux transporter periplasmic adaptor subunit [Balneolaceae bacterium]MBO6648685.1 HlyD family efflux transporter periplasmic adaptor subunit [Balneolaceae bacterium]
MEQFSFKQGNATIRHLKEPEKKKKKLNTDRVLFILLLVIIALYGSFKLYKGIAVIEIDGMVTMDKLEVHFTDDIRLNGLQIEEGASIQKGDTLFSYTNQYFENDGATYANIIANRERVNREIFGLTRQLNEKRTERSILEERLETQRFELEKIRELITLAAITRNSFDDQQRAIGTTEDDLELVKEEIRFLIRHIDQLSQLKKDYSSSAWTGGGGSQRKLYVAPTDGLIGRISVKENEVCYKGDEVMTIHQPQDLRIQAYFNQKEADKVEIGRIVSIEFPDGTKQKGVIKKYYVSTYELPDEFQKKYEPTERSILVDISPLNEDDLEGWKQFYKMSVKVSIGRFY